MVPVLVDVVVAAVVVAVAVAALETLSQPAILLRLALKRS